MTKYLILLAAIPAALLAQSLEGTWQGTLTPPNQTREIRMAFRITKDANGHQGVFYNLAANRQLNLGAITLQGNAVRIVIPGMGGIYDGNLDPDHNSIKGTLAQGTNPLPLLLQRATVTTAWELPPPPVAPKPLPDGTKLEFEVAAIKLSRFGQPGVAGFNVTATELRAPNISVAGLITFAFELHRTQIAGLPGWAETDGYDIAARLPQGGDPSDSQLRAMLKHLLQSRFGLAFHTEKRELSVYSIMLKNGPAGVKMVPSTSTGLNMGSQGLGRVRFRGANMASLAHQLQLRVVDRPVIDQSGLADRYDFTLDFRPDEFQFPHASAVQRAAAIARADALPDLFGAFQEQLGLKLVPTKTSADVLVIDTVSKPSEN